MLIVYNPFITSISVRFELCKILVAITFLFILLYDPRSRQVNSIKITILYSSKVLDSEKVKEEWNFKVQVTCQIFPVFYLYDGDLVSENW